MTVSIIIAVYILTAVAIVMWAGTGATGLGAGNPDNQESLFAALSFPILGNVALLIYIAVLASSFASLQSTMVGPARTVLAMGHYRALPPVFAKISPRHQTPSTATAGSAVAAGVFYIVTRIISENALWDTITALGLMICFYMASRPLLVFGTSERSFSTDLETSCTNWSAPALGGRIPPVDVLHHRIWLAGPGLWFGILHLRRGLRVRAGYGNPSPQSGDHVVHPTGSPGLLQG